MAVIVRIGENAGMIRLLRELAEKAEQGEFKSLVFAATMTDGSIATAWSQAGYGDMATLIGHLQTDLTWRMIQANADDL